MSENGKAPSLKKLNCTEKSLRLLLLENSRRVTTPTVDKTGSLCLKHENTAYAEHLLSF